MYFCLIAKFNTNKDKIAVNLTQKRNKFETKIGLSRRLDGRSGTFKKAF